MANGFAGAGLVKGMRGALQQSVQQQAQDRQARQLGGTLALGVRDRQQVDEGRAIEMRNTLAKEAQQRVTSAQNDARTLLENADKMLQAGADRNRLMQALGPQFQVLDKAIADAGGDPIYGRTFTAMIQGTPTLRETAEAEGEAQAAGAGARARGIARAFDVASPAVRQAGIAAGELPEPAAPVKPKDMVFMRGPEGNIVPAATAQQVEELTLANYQPVDTGRRAATEGFTGRHLVFSNNTSLPTYKKDGIEYVNIPGVGEMPAVEAATRDPNGAQIFEVGQMSERMRRGVEATTRREKFKRMAEVLERILDPDPNDPEERQFVLRDEDIGVTGRVRSWVNTVTGAVGALAQQFGDVTLPDGTPGIQSLMQSMRQAVDIPDDLAAGRLERLPAIENQIFNTLQEMSKLARGRAPTKLISDRHQRLSNLRTLTSPEAVRNRLRELVREVKEMEGQLGESIESGVTSNVFEPGPEEAEPEINPADEEARAISEGLMGG